MVPSLHCRRRAAAIAVMLMAVVSLAGATAHADIDVHATLNPQRAKVSEPLQLSIDVNGAQNVTAPAISVDGFDIQYVGPSTQISIVNGRMNSSVQHRYSLVPTRPGHFTIGPFTVEFQGKQYQTDSFSVEIVGAGQPPSAVARGQAAPGQAAQGAAPAGGALRLALSVPKTEVYLHERLPVDLNLYVGPVRAGDVQYPTLPGEGLSIEKFAEPSQHQQAIEGQTFQVLHFQTTIIPLRAGSLALGPATVALNVYDRRGRGGFFDDAFFAQPHPTNVRSEPITLTVLRLPDEGRPPSFSGAVGTFTMDVNAVPTELTAGDPVTLRINLTGSGNLSDAGSPALTSAAGFRTYEPHTTKAEGGVKSFEQVLIPNDANVQAVPPVRFSYFDPQSRQYRTLESQPIALVVRPPPNAPHADIVAGGAAAPRAVPEERLGHDIVLIKDDPGHLVARDTPWYGNWVFLAWQPVPLLLFVSAVWYDRRRRRLSGDVRYARFTRAGREARRGLAAAEAALAQANRQAFYDAVSRTMREYLAAKLDLPPSGIDADSISGRGVPEDYAQRIHEFFATCEHARFAQSTADGDMRGTLALAREVVRRLERERGLGPRFSVGGPRAGRLAESPGRTGGALLWLLMLLCAGAVRAADAPASPHTTFFHANALYKDGQYAAAAQEYEELLHSDLASGNVYFNLGNAYFKAGEKGKAILNYERARRRSPNDPDVAANLAYAQSSTGAEACAAGLWERLAFPLAHRLATEWLVWMASVAYTVLLIALSAYRLWPQRPRWLVHASTALGVIAVVATTSLARQVMADDWQRQAVIIAEGETAARFEPADNGTVHFALKEGSMVRVLDRRDQWLQIARCDDRRGWVKATALETL